MTNHDERPTTWRDAAHDWIIAGLVILVMLGGLYECSGLPDAPPPQCVK